MKAFKKFLVLLMAVMILGTVSVSVSAASLATPKVTVSNTASSGKSKLKWEKVAKAKKYYIYRSTKKTSGYKKIGTTTKTYYTDSDASVGKTYYYKVKAVGTSASKYSNYIKSVRICAQPDLTVKVNSTTGKPSLSWDKVSGAKEYKVYRSYDADGAYELIKTTTATSYTDTKAYVDTDCWYRVDVVGKKSGADSKPEKPVAVHTACAKPEITVSNDQASGDPVISWGAVDGAVSYSVYRSAKSGSGYKKIGATDEYSYQDESATPGKKYYYKVRAYCESGAKSAYSSYKSVYSDCARPEVEITLNSSQKPKLTWKKVSGAEKYEVHRATSKSGTYTKIKTTTSTKYTDSSAKTGKTYYYKVKAIASTSSANSVYSAVLSSNIHVHKYTPKVTMSTCTAGGYTVYTCTCGDSYRDAETQALGHDYTSKVVAATCQEGGYTVHTCSRCGDSYTDAETAALGHKYVSKVIAATCEESGYTRHTCANCGDSYTDGNVPAIGHNYKSTVVTPKCEEKGYTSHECSVCGDTYTDAEVPATGHVNTHTERQEPTCVEAGWEKTICDACGEQVGETKKLSATGKHSFETTTLPNAAKRYRNYWGYDDYGKYDGYSDINCDQCKTCFEIDDSSFRIKYSQSEIANTMLGYVNALREQNGLNKLKISSSIMTVADRRAKEISSNFAHSGTGYDENITNGGGVSNCIKGAYNKFLNSSAHKANMLSEDIEYFGCDIYYKDGKTYCVQLFG